MATETVDTSGGGRNDFSLPASPGPEQVDRVCKIIVTNIVPNKFQVDDNNAILFDLDGTNKEQGGLRIKFDFKRPFIWTPTIGKIEIYNLGPDSRAKLQAKNCRVLIQAGYRSTGLKQVGILSATQINHRREGADWITKLEGGDAGRQFWHGRVNMSFGAKTPILDVVKKISSKFAVKLGAKTQDLINQATSGKSFKNGASFNGNAAEELRYVLRQAGLDMFVADESLYVVPPDGNVGNVFVIGPDSGLINSPEYSAPPHPGKPQLLKFKMLLKPELLQGSTISLNSEFHKGIYRLREVHHKGDTWGQEWYTEVEAWGAKLAT